MGVLAQGRSSLFNPNTGPHTALVQVYLVPPDKRTRDQVKIMNEVRPNVQKLFPGVLMIFDPGGIVKRIVSFGSQAAVDVEIYGYEFEKARPLIRQIDAIMHQTPGLADIQISREENYPEVNISNEYFISAWLDEAHRKDLSDLDRILLTTSSGTPVLLKNVANLKLNSGPVKIDRKYFQRIVHITANPVGRDLGTIAADLEKKFAGVQMPEGFSIRLAGQIQQQRETFQGLVFATVLALMLVYMVMAAQFKSLMDPFIIMFSIPMGFPGVIVMLFLTKTTFSVTSFMGVIMMLGIVVSNGVLLVDYTNVLRRRGVELHRAAVQGARTRLRPILMTSLATVFGLLPMALGLGTGGETNAPLARAVIGGLTVSTILTLFLVPTLYVMLEERFPRKAEEMPPAALVPSPAE